MPPAEIGGMAWSEIDLERGVWTLPAARSKNGRSHTLPLLPSMLAIIEAVPRMAGRDQLFGQRADGFTGWSRGKAVLDERSRVKNWTTHDIRRTVATKLADSGVQPHIIEQILNHQSGHKAARGHLQPELLRARGARRAGVVGGPRPHAGCGWQAQDPAHVSTGPLTSSAAACNTRPPNPTHWLAPKHHN